MRAEYVGLGAALLAGLAFGVVLLGDVGTAVAASTPKRWRPYHGARPEIWGSPKGSILAVPGIDRLSARARAILLDVAEELGIPVDSLAVVISHESGVKASAINSLPAAGLIQLTVDAKLPGFDTEERVREVATWSAEKQLREVVLPFMQRLVRQRPELAGATPGELLVGNFLPSDVGKPADFRMGDATSEDKFRRAVYRSNHRAFDLTGKGYFTVADAHARAARVAESAKGERVTMLGRRVLPARAAQPSPGAPSDASGAKAPQGAAKGRKLAPRPAAPPRRRPAPSAAPARGDAVPSRGLLLAAVARGEDEAPQWVEVPWQGHTVRVGAHALRAPWQGELLRLPASFRDAVAIARARGWVLPTAELSDAIWRAASVKLEPRPLPPDDRMTRMGHVLLHNQELERQIADSVWKVELTADDGKTWILSARNTLKSGAATNYGWRRLNGAPLQPLGPATRPPPHNDEWIDYSQVLRPIQRYTAEGRDLLDIFVEHGLPEAAVSPLR